jgi:hypothetical protein
MTTEHAEEAVRIVKQTFGDTVDLSPGTSGSVMVKIIIMQMEELAALRAQLEAMLLK